MSTQVNAEENGLNETELDALFDQFWAVEGPKVSDALDKFFAETRKEVQ
jgi:hypothetical protein